MAAFNFHRRQIRRWWYAGATLVAVAFFTVFFVGGAFAIVSGSPSNFESVDAAVPNSNPPLPDGNMTNDATGHSDWNCFANGSGATGFVGSGITVGTTPCNSNLVPSAAFAKTDPAATTSDDSWVNGTKMDTACAPVGTNKNPPKDDFTNIASYTETLASNKNQYLYGATIRYAPNGNASENVELNQKAGTAACPITRTAGDHLLAFDYLNGGGTLDLHVLTWIDSTNPTADGQASPGGKCIIKTDSMPCWGANVITPSAASFEGDVSQSAITAAKNGISGQALAAGQFAEFGVNLTTALGQNPNACNTTNQITWESRASGSSFSSNPEDISIESQTISNCGRIIIHKQTGPRGVNQAFGFDSNIPNPSGTVTTSSSPYCQGDTTPNGTPGFSLNDNGNTSGNNAANTEDCTNVLQGSYTINEETVSGFTLSGIVCTKTTGGTSTVTYGSGNHSTFTAGDTSANITLAPSETVECTYTNHQNTSSLSTQASNTGSVTPGTGVYDTATATGDSVNGSTPSGSVTFYLCGPLTTATGCDNTGTKLTPDGTLSGSGITATATSPTVNSTTALSPGIYCFAAYWGGDTNYPGGNSTTATNECFTVSKINTQTVTTPNDGSGVAGAESTITLGETIYDTAVVTGTSVGGDPTGSVVFHVCAISSGTCTTGGDLVGSSNGVTLVSDGNANTYTSSATSDGFTPTATGRYCFRGDYGGSTVYNTSSDSSSTECFTVTDTTTSSSAQTWYPNDSASVTADNGATLNGTLTIQLYTGDNCGATSGSAVSGQSYSSGDQTGKTTITVSSNKQTTFGVDTNNAGNFSWKVVFTSDDQYVGNSSHCEKSSLTITN